MMWKEKYKIGVELIDRQHEELFRRVSDFIGTVRSEVHGGKLSKIKETLEFMKDYVITTFAMKKNIRPRLITPAWRNINRFMTILKQKWRNLYNCLKKPALMKIWYSGLAENY